MLDVTVKTLDGQNRSFSVPDDMTVRQFKDRIAGSINVTADTQRLIFQGRVLQDDKLLKDYDVHGKVVHVVMRAPPTAGRGQSNNDTPPTNSASGRDPNSRVVGSFTLPADILNANMVQNIAQDAIRSMGNLGRNARVSTRSSPDGSNVDVHIHLGPMQAGQTSEAQMRLNTARQMIRLANEAINQYENPEGQEGAGNGSGATAATSSGTESSGSGPAGTATTDRPTSHSPMETSDTEDDRTTSSTAASTESSTAGSGNSTVTMETGTESTTTTGTGSSSTTTTTGSSSTTTTTGSSSTTTTTTTGGSSTAATGTSTENQSDPSSQPGAPPRGPVRPNISALSEVLLDVQQLNQRIQPYMERFQRIVQEDGELEGADQRNAQNVCNLVLEVMHSIGHGYHALSDLMVDLSQQRPRQLYVTLTIAHPHTRVIQQTIPVQVPISLAMAAPGSGVSTASTGTSTARPSTAETGTQPSATSTGTAGVQVGGAALTEAEIRRMTEEMTAGIQNVIGQGLQQGDGSPDNPFVFVEMRPDSMTVNSISAEVVTTSEPGISTADGASSTTGETAGARPPQATPTTQPQATRSQGQAPPTQSQATPQAQVTGQSGFLQQLLEVTGVNGGGPQRMQIQIGNQRPPGFPGMAGMGPGAHGFMFGPMMMRAGAPVSESGTQTAGAGPRPANSATQTSTPTSTFGTQTSTSSSQPSSTSGTQTPQGPPRTTAFVLPGMHGAHGPQGLPTPDPHLQCSSRHFLTRYARTMMNQPSPLNDTGLADMVGNLMSGLLGAGNRPGPQPAATTTSTANTESRPAAGSQSQPRPAAPPTGPQPPRAQMMAGLPPFFPGRMPFIPGMTMRMSMPRPPTSQATPTSSSQTPPTAGPQPSPASSSSAGGVGGGQGGENQFVQMLRSMLQTANTGSGTQPSPSSTTGGTATTTDQNQNIQPQSGASSQPISDEAFTQLVSGITSFMAQAAMGQAPRQTITDFLSQLGDNYNLPMGEGFINEGLSCILAHLQITDLIQVFYGNAQALNQVQGPLRGFILTRVLNGAPPTQENIRTSVVRLVEQMEPEIQETVNSVTPRPHIDFHGTLVNFFHQQFANVVSLIINARDGDANFGQDLYACIRRLLSELFILCSRCLGGMTAVQQLVTQRLQTLTTGINPLVQDWMNSMTARQLLTFIPTINITESEVSFYVVYTGQTVRESSASATQPTPSVSSTKKAAPTTTQTQSPAPAASKPTPPPRPQMDRASNSVKPPQRVPSPDKAPAARRESEKVSSSSQPMDTSPISSASEASSESQDLPRAAQGVEVGREPVSTTSNGGVSTAVNGRDWEAVVPTDWVPVIAQDIERQQSQPAQTPHSDVYLQGMPPKRRKIMADDKPNNLSNVAEAFPDSMRRAVAAARVEPISSLDNLTAEAANDTDLHRSYDSEIQSSLTCRVNTDSDYKSDRFPNTEDYYHKTDGDKK